MKKIFLLISLSLTLIACQDVIELDLDEGVTRLVIDAEIELLEDGSTRAIVQLNRTTGFYQEIEPIVPDASIRVITTNGGTHNFQHTGGGIYENNTLDVQENTDYTLIIEDQGEVYTATERLVNAVPLVDVLQEPVPGVPDLYNITVFYDDPVGEGNNYLFSYEDAGNYQLDARDDAFADGNRTPSIFFVEDFVPGRTARATIAGIDERCHDFYFKLFEISSGGGNPFGSPPFELKGNISNPNNEDLYPYGYFRISEKFTLEFTLEDILED